MPALPSQQQLAAAEAEAASAEAALKEAGSRFERRAATLQQERAAAEEALGRAETELQALHDAGERRPLTPSLTSSLCWRCPLVCLSANYIGFTQRAAAHRVVSLPIY